MELGDDAIHDRPADVMARVFKLSILESGASAEKESGGEEHAKFSERDDPCVFFQGVLLEDFRLRASVGRLKPRDEVVPVAVRALPCLRLDLVAYAAFLDDALRARLLFIV